MQCAIVEIESGRSYPILSQLRAINVLMVFEKSPDSIYIYKLFWIACTFQYDHDCIYGCGNWP